MPPSRRLFLAAPAAAVPLLSSSRAASAAPVSCAPRPRGMFGVAAGQMLRVSVFNHHASSQSFDIAILDEHGVAIGKHQGVAAAGAGAFADFDVARGLEPGQRAQVHCEVTAHDLPLGASAEVYALATGATLIPPDPCLTPAPDPLRRMGSIGMIRGQTARVSVFHHHPDAPPEAAAVRVQFVDLDGKLLAWLDDEVPYGAGAYWDWGDGQPGFPKLAVGQRVQIHVDVLTTWPELIGASLEIHDPATGLTLIPPDPCLSKW